MLDTSISVLNSNFAKVREFIKNFVQQLDIGPNSAQVGVATFDSVPRNEFWLNEHTDRTSLLAAIDQISYPAGTTNTADALQFIRDNAFTPVGPLGLLRLVSSNAL